MKISWSGLSMVPPSFTALFSALDTDVFVFLLTPSNQFFFDIASPKQMGCLSLEDIAASGADQADGHYEIANPWLASPGRPGRQFHAGLESFHYLEPFEDLFMGPAPPGTFACMLHQLQSDTLYLVDRGNDCDHKPVPVAEHDRSICIHACHSPMREAQVLKDLLLCSAVADKFEISQNDIQILEDMVSRMKEQADIHIHEL